MEFQLRPALPEDFDLTLQIKAQSLKPYIDLIWGWDDQQQYDYHEKNYRPEDIRMILLKDEEVGYLEVTETEEFIWLKNIFIVEDHQNKGIGGDILKQELKDAGLKNKPIRLHVFKINKKAQALYERLGFRVVGKKDLKLVMQATP